MSARRKRVISTEERQFNHKPAKMLLTKKEGSQQKKNTPSIIGICSYCILDRPVFERCQTLLHPELTPWWSFLLADGAHHKKPHSPTHPITWSQSFSQRFVFLGIFFSLGDKSDNKKRCDEPRGRRGRALHAAGVYFANISLQKGILRQF